MDKKELSTSRQIIRGLCIMMLALGIALILFWGIFFGIWWDIGLYSIVVMLILFGITGGLLYSMPESEGESGPK